MSRSRAISLAALGAWTCLAVSCASSESAPRSVLAPPGVALTLRQFTGSSLTGPLATRLDEARPENCYALHATVTLVDGPVDDLLAPVATEANLISSLMEGQPVAPAIRLARGARVGRFPGTQDLADALDRRPGENRVPGVPIGDLRAALPPGTTAAFDFSWRESLERSETRPTRVTVEVFRPPEETPSAAEAAGADPATSTPLPDFDPSRLVAAIALEDDAAGARRSELIVLGEIGDRTLALLVPAPEGLGEGRYLAWTVSASVPPRGEEPGALVHQNAFLRTLSSLERAAANALEDAAQLTVEIARERELELARDGLDKPGSRRASLVRLADAASAPLAARLAVSVPDAQIEVLAARVAEALRGDNILSRPSEFAFAVEKAALAWAVETRQKSTEGEPLLGSLLLSRAGQAGTDGSLLYEVLGHAKTLAELEGRLVEENFIFLQDNSPAARARAFDWLAQRGRAPEGFRPLDPTPERRAALAAATTAATTEEKR